MTDNRNQSEPITLTDNVTQSKAQLRTSLKNAPAENCLINITTIPFYEKAQTLFFFIPLKDEINTIQAIKKALQDGKRIALPRIRSTQTYEMDFFYINTSKDLKAQVASGSFAILEPHDNLTKAHQSDLTPTDIVFFPGLAFTKDGKRLGRGKGYYDRYFASLSNAPKRPLFIGVCFESHILPAIPVGPHDVDMDAVLTEKTLYICKKN